MTTPVPTVILGGTGYVAGELIRILMNHPHFRIAGVMSDSNARTPIRTAFPHLEPLVGNMSFVGQDALIDVFGKGRHAMFSAAPHGTSAKLVNTFIDITRGRKSNVTIVDVSADFRFRTAAAYEAVYGHPHGAQRLLEHFACALPEHLPATERAHIAHPGCFATALLLAMVPLLQLDATEEDFYASGVTGSTGAGRSPTPTTHHPERHSNLFAYQPLAHRHAPEVMALCEEATGVKPVLHFVPHSGPFSRGIYMTVQAKLRRAVTAEGLRESMQQFYAGSPFVKVIDGMPRLKDVVGSNFSYIGVSVKDGSLAVTVVIDNLIKGAAGGAVQWMNRKFGFADDAGLRTPALGWE